MNGMDVIKRLKTVVYLRIPPDLQRPIDGGCDCDYCKAHRDETPKWDTLAVPVEKPKKGHDGAWTVHMPTVR